MNLANYRARHQKGLLTWSRNGKDLFDYVVANDGVFPEGTLIKVRARSSDQEKCQVELKLLDVEPGRVMGDRDGISLSIYNDVLRFAE